MPREKLVKKVGSVGIVKWADSPNLAVRWWEPGSPGRRGRWHWQSVKSPKLEVAVRQAEWLDELARRRKGLVPLAEERRPLLLGDVVAMDFAVWNVEESQRRRYEDEVRKFVGWLIDLRRTGEQVPVEDFSVSDLTAPLLQRYIAHLRARGQAHDGIRHAIYPLRRAARYAEQFGVPNRIKDIKLRRQTPVEIRWVRLEVLSDFIAGIDRPDIAAIAALQGFVGLRVREALRLRLCDYDRERQTIEITGTAKTLSSFRVIPICAQAADYLNRWLDSNQPAGEAAPIFSTRRSAAWRDSAYGAALRRYLRAAGLDLAPKDLRACFATHCESTLGIRKLALDRYMGHGSSIRAVHYTARVVADLRRDVAGPLEKSLEESKIEKRRVEL